MITAKMTNDKYVELSPDWPYEVEWYDSEKIKLKDYPRIYPASDLQLEMDGKPITPRKRVNKTRKIMKTIGVALILLIICIVTSFIGYIADAIFPHGGAIFSIILLFYFAYKIAND